MSDTMHQSDSQYGEIELRNITKEFGEESSVSTVVEDCSFVVERGKFTVLIGPSGCGKTTLIDMMAGYEKPTSGEIKLDGEPIAGSSSERLVVFQETALFPWMTTLDNIMYGPRVQRERSEKDIEKAYNILEVDYAVNITPSFFRSHYIKKMNKTTDKHLKSDIITAYNSILSLLIKSEVDPDLTKENNTN